MTQVIPIEYYCLSNIFYNEIEIQSINFAFYEKVDIPNVKVSLNNEYTLEFWSFIYSYVPGKFTSLEVSWNLHAKIIIMNNPANQLVTQCYPFVDIVNNSYTNFAQDIISEGKWSL
jgi:hypothetical protein